MPFHCFKDNLHCTCKHRSIKNQPVNKLSVQNKLNLLSLDYYYYYSAWKLVQTADFVSQLVDLTLRFTLWSVWFAAILLLIGLSARIRDRDDAIRADYTRLLAIFCFFFKVKAFLISFYQKREKSGGGGAKWFLHSKHRINDGKGEKESRTIHHESKVQPVFETKSARIAISDECN